MGLACAFALLFSACLRADVSMVVNDDGSGTVSQLFAINQQAVKALGQFGGSDSSSTPALDAATAVKQIDVSKLPAGSKVDPYKDGDFEGARVTMPFKDPSEIPGLLTKADAAGSGFGDASTGAGSSSSPSETFQQFTLTHDGDTWRFSAIVPASNADAQLGGAGDQELAKTLFKDASVTIDLKLPGSITDHNADKVANDGSLTWNLDIFSDKPRTLTATSDASSGSSLLPIIGVAVLLLLVVGGAVAFFVMRGRNRASGGSGAAA